MNKIIELNGSHSESFIDFLKEIPEETNYTLRHKDIKLPNYSEMFKILEAQYRSDNFINIGAFDNNYIIGFANLRLLHPEHPNAKHIGEFGLMVLKDFWGTGISNELLSQIESKAFQLGVIRLEAKVRVGNKRGIRFYYKNGYTIEGTRARAALINDEFVDEYYIRKFI